jgi:hypothetical protein
MAEALPSIHDAPLANYPSLIAAIAHQSAIKVVKQRLRAQGLRLSEFSAREIRIRSEDYFELHRQTLIEDAIETVRKAPGFRTLAEREARRRGRNGQ